MSKINTRPPTPEEQSTLAASTAWVIELLAKEFNSDILLAGTKDDIPTLHSMLGEGPYTSDASAELTTFGIVFGHILAREIPLRWVVYRDEQGSDFALQYQDLELFVFPADMLIKRVEAGDDIKEIDLEAMLDDLRKALEEEAPKLARKTN